MIIGGSDFVGLAATRQRRALLLELEAATTEGTGIGRKYGISIRFFYLLRRRAQRCWQPCSHEGAVLTWTGLRGVGFSQGGNPLCGGAQAGLPPGAIVLPFLYSYLNPTRLIQHDTPRAPGEWQQPPVVELMAAGQPGSAVTGKLNWRRRRRGSPSLGIELRHCWRNFSRALACSSVSGF